MVWWYVLRMITQEQAETRGHVPPQIGNTHNTQAHTGAQLAHLRSWVRLPLISIWHCLGRPRWLPQQV